MALTHVPTVRLATQTDRVRRPSGVVLPAAQCSWSTRSIAAFAGAALAAGTIAIAAYTLRSDHDAPVVNVATCEVAETAALAVTHEDVVSADDPMVRYPIPNVHGTLLTAMYPSLGTEWIHPVVGTERTLPLLPSGHFGAERAGALRVICGRGGHCGSDLDGPIGRPIVAVTAGTVHEIDRSRNGKDGRSGRYVRIEHDDGVMTSYMHLNSIADGLEIGDRIEPGQQVGTLGKTGIHSAHPHLHFSIEVPKVPGTTGRRASLRYVDPAPFLLRSTIREHARPEKRSRRFS
jgi:hypothetical protein